LIFHVADPTLGLERLRLGLERLARARTRARKA